MIDLDSVRFAWPGASRDCLAIARLNIAAGSQVFLCGASGAGKSTLLGLLAGVLLPTSGRVQVLNQVWSALPGARRDRLRADHVGYIFQQFNLLPYLSVIDNVVLPCQFSASRRQRAVARSGSVQHDGQSLLARLGLAEAWWRRPAAALSVGQQQRVAAARSLIGVPEIVIADEPTSALDAPLRDEFMAVLLEECRRGASTLIFVSHDDRLATHFDRRLMLADINQVLPPGGAAP